MLAAGALTAFALAAVALAAVAAEPGWTPGDPRTDFTTPDGVVWRAPLDEEPAFRIERREGAEGEVSFVSVGGERALRIRKTNERGCIVVTARTGLSVAPGETVRAAADVSSDDADPEYALGFLRLWGRTERLDFCRRADGQAFGSGGMKMGALSCAPAGRPERKFAHFLTDGESGTNLTCAIVVAGAPSESVWRNWHVESYSAVQRRWNVRKEQRQAKDFSSDRVSDDVLAAALADGDHTARVVKRDGAPVLEVDGASVPPVFYKSRVKLVWNSLSDGKNMLAAGVRIHVPMVRFGAAPRRTCAWTPAGFDAERAADDLEKEMRVAPDALYVVSTVIDPYPEFVEEHPDEAWRTASGRRVFGSWIQAERAVADGEKSPAGTWPWVSVHSDLWRESVKSNFTAFVGELRRRGLSRRVIGFHLAGSHDGQFAAAYPDFSPASVRAFRNRLRTKYGTAEALSAAWKRPVASFGEAVAPKFGSDPYLDASDRERMDFVEHLKQGPFNALEDIARHVKRLFGKDVIAMRWCLGAFSGNYEGAYDIGSFLDSDVFDILVAQPSYSRRQPALAIGCKQPHASYRNRGKLHMWEFDLRTYGAIEEWARTEATLCGECSSGDPATWCAVHRRAAGRMLADGMGFWYFDMAGGWFNPPEVRADVTALMRDIRTLPPRTSWRPSAAVVIDEQGALLRNLPAKEGFPHVQMALSGQVELLAGSGVPFDVWLAEDLLRDPSLAADYRLVVFSEMLRFDERRRALVESLAHGGRTLVFLGDSGRLGGAEETTGFRPVHGTGPSDHFIVPESGVPADCCRSAMWADYGRHDFGVTNGWRYAVLCAPRTTVEETPGVRVLARYAADGKPALAVRDGTDVRRVFVCDPGGLTPAFFNRLVRKCGGYAAARDGLQVDTDGRFVSVHCLRPGRYELRLPAAGCWRNVKSGTVEAAESDVLTLDLSAGETRWYVLER